MPQIKRESNNDDKGVVGERQSWVKNILSQISRILRIHTDLRVFRCFQGFRSFGDEYQLSNYCKPGKGKLKLRKCINTLSKYFHKLPQPKNASDAVSVYITFCYKCIKVWHSYCSLKITNLKNRYPLTGWWLFPQKSQMCDLLSQRPKPLPWKGFFFLREKEI